MRLRRHDDDDYDKNHDDFDEGDFDDDEENPFDPEDEELPLIACPHCRRMIWEEAEQCPYCEHYVVHDSSGWSPRSKWITATAILCLIVVLSWILFSH